MSYFKSLAGLGAGPSGADVSAIIQGLTQAGTQIAQTAHGISSGTAPYGTPGYVDPMAASPTPPPGMYYDATTGTFQPLQQTSYTVPLVIGGLAVLGLVGFMYMRRPTPNRRVRRNSRRVRRNTSPKRSSQREDRIGLTYFDDDEDWGLDAGSGGGSEESEGSLFSAAELAEWQPPTRRRKKRRSGTSRGSTKRKRRFVRRNPRSLAEIASEIRRDWKAPYFGAVPYINAMSTMGRIGESYGADPGREIVAYFLGNATGWRGPTAKRIKAELNAMLKSPRRNAAKKSSKPKPPKFSDLGVYDSVARVRQSGSPTEMAGLLPPGVAAKFKKLPPGLYKYGWGPKKGEAIVQFKNASLRGALTSTRIGASKVGEYHWVVDNYDPKFPVIIRGIDDKGRSYFRVEEYAQKYAKVPVYAVKKKAASK